MKSAERYSSSRRQYLPAEPSDFIVYLGSYTRRRTVNSMARIAHPSRTIASVLLLLVIGGFSTHGHAWEGDKRAPWVGTMLNGTKCDGGQVPFGPYDYLQRHKLQAQLEVVEESHFNKDVESLKKGMSSSAMGDIHYTLQTWPNHHRALNSALRYRLQHRELWKVGNNTAENYPAECYLQRAMKFSPKDPIPYMLHGLLMHQMKQYEAALKSYQQAVKLRPDDLITQYNMGLTLVELKKFREAEEVAKVVYAADFPLPGLKNKLAKARQSKARARAAKSGTNAAVDPGAKQSKADVKASKSVRSEEPPVSPDAPAKDSPSESPESAPAKAGTTVPPALSAEQLAILKQAMKAQAAKTEGESAKTAAP